MLDPRPLIIDKRLEKIKRIITVTGWKGGIGKSSVAAVLALNLAKQGLKTGLLDLDLTGASANLILGGDKSFPEEIDGLMPPTIAGVKLMDITYFTDNEAVPLRGNEISDAILELLAVTNWGELDYLVIDMPPGIADASLDIMRWIKRAEILIVTIPSKLSTELVKRSLKLYEELNFKILGGIENMSNGDQLTISDLRLLGTIARDANFEQCIGNPKKILQSKMAQEINNIAIKHIV